MSFYSTCDGIEDTVWNCNLYFDLSCDESKEAGREMTPAQLEQILRTRVNEERVLKVEMWKQPWTKGLFHFLVYKPYPRIRILPPP